MGKLTTLAFPPPPLPPNLTCMSVIMHILIGVCLTTAKFFLSVAVREAGL